MSGISKSLLQCPNLNTLSDLVVLGHGSGGRLTSGLIEKLFAPAFGNFSEPLHDGAFIKAGESRLAFTTDSFVVSPLFFPGGDIGHLAVNGTVNDLAVCGAKPLALSCGFILEEGFAMLKLERIVKSMRQAADRAGVSLVTGDTKVVEKGKGDGVYINTSGVGVIENKEMRPGNISPGDAIIVSGDIGRHGTAIMSVREGLAFETELVSDTQELGTLARALLSECPGVSCMRDITRGGLATVLVEFSRALKLSLKVDEALIPVDSTVRGAAEFLGLDPLYIACEGRMVVFVAPRDVEKGLEVMRRFHPAAAVIGEVESQNAAIVRAKTTLGTYRLLDLLTGEQLPRIC